MPLQNKKQGRDYPLSPTPEPQRPKKVEFNFEGQGGMARASVDVPITKKLTVGASTNMGAFGVSKPTLNLSYKTNIGKK